MCGIAGFIDQAPGNNMQQVVQRMAESLQSRGPDDSGIWLDQEAGIALGHQRLSILDLSSAGHQPMASNSGRFVLAFNGEIYNHLALRKTLDSRQENIPWRGHSDTETLLAYIEAYGFERTLQDITGMFAIAVWDKQRGSLLLARDRLGEKPLYYGWQGKSFLFGSQVKALRPHPAFLGKLDRNALTLYLRHNFIPAPYSIYAGIRKLPAGTWLEVSREQAGLSPTPYWQLTPLAEQSGTDLFEGSDDNAETELEKLMTNAVRGQMLSDVPLGALLSGGIDSSTVCALMQSCSTQPIKTFTIGFPEKQYSEADHARAVARHLGTDHTELILNPEDALAIVPDLPGTWDEPFADSSQLPTLMVMKLAREHVTVALSGDGGDELFSGYNRYSYAPRLSRRLGWMPAVAQRSIGKLLTALPASVLNRSLGSLTPLHGLSLPGDKAHKLGQKLQSIDIGNIDDLYRSLLTSWENPNSLVIGGAIPDNLLNDDSRWPRTQDPVARMMALDGLIYLPDDILVKVDRAAMAVSLETRTPFLDRHLVEFGWRLPMHFKQRNGQGKWILRRLLDRYVPRELVERPKAGFSIPLDQWLRGPLLSWAEDLLAEERLMREGIFNPAPIRRVLQQHTSGRGNYGQQLWSVLMFQCWLEANS